MRILIVGGDFGDTPKASSVINKIAGQLSLASDISVMTVVNGGSINDLFNVQISIDVNKYDLMLWMANVSNDEDKVYPRKSEGCVLICSKQIRDGRGNGDAVARVFKMHANAVMTVSGSKPFTFNLLDALANSWGETNNISHLCDSIVKLYTWTKMAQRMNSEFVHFRKNEVVPLDKSFDRLCAITRIVADKVETERGGRYFGNISTRCAAMFPSMRIPNNVVLMSARNTNKQRLSPEDFVHVKLVDGTVQYDPTSTPGGRKPSVDAPIQLSLYREYPNINFIMHGHAFIEDAPFTKCYFPCGDLREVQETADLVKQEDRTFIINLKNHGFVIGADTLDRLELIVRLANFKYRELYQLV